MRRTSLTASLVGITPPGVQHFRCMNHARPCGLDDRPCSKMHATKLGVVSLPGPLRFNVYGRSRMRRSCHAHASGTSQYVVERQYTVGGSQIICVKLCLAYANHTTSKAARFREGNGHTVRLCLHILIGTSTHITKLIAHPPHGEYERRLHWVRLDLGS